MASNKVAFGVLAIVCVLAAGGGAYLASRYNADELAGGAAATAAREASPTAAAPPSVAETEGVVGESAKPQPPARAEMPEAARPVADSAAKPTTRTDTRPVRSASKRSASSPVPAPTARASAPAAAAEVREEAPRPTVPASPAPEPDSRTVARPAEATPPADTAFPPPSREPQRTFEELVVSPDSVIGLQIETALTSERARVEDRVEARVTRDVKVGDRIAIPAGSRMVGSVTQVERGGKIRERARLGVRFHTLVLADGSEMPVSTDTLYREGAPPSKESAAKIGGAAAGGAILGAILGGGKGAATGAAVGAAGGTAAVMAGDRNAAVLSAGSNVTVRVLSPVTITIEKQ